MTAFLSKNFSHVWGELTLFRGGNGWGGGGRLEIVQWPEFLLWVSSWPQSSNQNTDMQKAHFM